MKGEQATSGISLKRRLRTCVDRVANWTGVTSGFERRMRRGVTTLMYHRVLPDAQCADYPFASLVMPESAFAEQVHWLAQHCTVVTALEAMELVNDREAGAEPEQPIVAITFDDGYRDNHDIAAPILEDAGVRGTFFVTTQPVATHTLLWYDLVAVQHLDTGVTDERFGTLIENLKHGSDAERVAYVNALARFNQSPHAERFAMMTPEQVGSLAQRGHEIGGHTITHPILPSLTDDNALEELTQSRATLEAWTGMPVTGLAYPNGDYDERISNLARQAGYAYAVTTEPGIHELGADVMSVPRVDVTPHRVCNENLQYDELAFRSEICQLREAWR